MSFLTCFLHVSNVGFGVYDSERFKMCCVDFLLLFFSSFLSPFFKVLALYSPDCYTTVLLKLLLLSPRIRRSTTCSLVLLILSIHIVQGITLRRSLRRTPLSLLLKF